MACYGGGDHRYNDTDEDWIEYTHLLQGDVIVEICQWIDVKRVFMGITMVNWNTIGTTPALTALSDYDWEAHPEVNPLGVIQALMVQARSALASLISATYIDESCIKWRWTNTAAMTAALPTTTADDEKEDWLAWVEAARAVLELMEENVSDPWESGVIELVITVEESEYTAERYMQEGAGFDFRSGSGTVKILSFRAEGDYNRFGDCSGETVNFSGAEAEHSLTVNSVFAFPEGVLVRADVGCGQAFYAVSASPAGSPAVAGAIDFFQLVGDKDATRSGHRVLVDGLSPTGYKATLDDGTSWPGGIPVTYDPTKQGWFVLRETRRKYKVEFPSVPGEIDGTFSVAWETAQTVGDYQHDGGGGDTTEQEQLAPCLVVQTDTEVLVSQGSPGYMEFTATLDEDNLPIDPGDFPENIAQSGLPGAFLTKVGYVIPGLYFSGGKYWVGYCRDACGIVHIHV